ncbi:hypothetical protein FOZ63_024872 [Perkinsus olseni]|uniref:Uncharacterized protein n=1 Tax=Perkinsus olseni TaxID=32597 RepID=A0A7J6TYC5_PEROL|nr:hypothetical protein FOZ60_007724 [Perkinsus olseni]KAF4709536.1 hypothetical protein FOZ63_024872 [Perkinsus olseni]KAF4749617.1 hypothetical protein FOZ62_023341 [Perkinsus olseni]
MCAASLCSNRFCGSLVLRAKVKLALRVDTVESTSRGEPRPESPPTDKGLDEEHPFEAALRSLESEAGQAVADDVFGDNSFKDGGPCNLPGTAPTLSPGCDSVGKRIAAVLWDAGKASGFSDTLRSVSGAPTEDQVGLLQGQASVAAAAASREIKRMLGIQDAETQPENRVDGRLLEALARELGVDDVEFGKLCADGLPIGISREIPPCPLFPRYKKKTHPPFPAKRVGQGFRNYPSMSDPCAVEAVDETVRREQALGFIRQLSAEEVNDPSRTFVPRGSIPKKDGKVRVVDDYLRANINLRANVPNTCELPSVVNTRRLVGELQEKYPTRKWLLFELDLESAYRYLGVAREERKHLSFCHRDGNGVTTYFENCSLPFGLNSSGFWFVRYVRAVQSCAAKILQAWLPEGSAAGLMYVDDGLWLVDPEHYIEVCTVISLLWTLIGSRLSFKKMRAGQRLGCFIGVTLDVESPGEARFFLSAEKLARTKELLTGLVRTGKISLQDLASLAGKLSHYSQLRPFLKPHLQPFFGLKAAMEHRSLAVAKCPRGSEVSIVASFFLTLLALPSSAHPAGGISRAVRTRSQTLTIATDASLTALGGVIALSGPASGPRVFFFRTLLGVASGDPGLSQWGDLVKDVSTGCESRNIVALELLAAALGLLAADSVVKGAADYNVVLFTDNTAVEAILTKMYSPKPALAKLLRRMTHLLSQLTLTTFLVRRVDTKSNVIADGLSRGSLQGLPTSWKELHAPVSGIPLDL